MDDIIEIKWGCPATADERARDAYLLPSILQVAGVALLPVLIFFILRTFRLQPNLTFMQSVCAHLFIALLIVLCAGGFLGSLVHLLGPGGVIINGAEQRVTDWRRNLFLLKRKRAFTVNDFRVVGIVHDRHKLMFGYNNGFSVKLIGAEKQVHVEFFEDRQHALALAEKISRCIHLPVERTQT